jgi:exonuclease SbcC
MAFKAHIQNFQSIEDAEIVVDGFTVITGSNNTGKTALVRAILGAFQNTRGHRYVRHGAKQCTVSLEFDSGDKLKWEKGKGVNRYVINGKTYDKVGAGVPDAVAELGVFPLAIGGHTLWPQIAKQFDGQVFLLNQPGSVLAEAVADVERVGVLNRALRDAQRDQRSTESTLKVRREDRKAARERVEAFEDLGDVDTLVKQIEERYAHIKKIAATRSKLVDLHTRLEEAKETVRRLEGVEDIDLPDLSAAKEQVSEVTKLRPLKRDLDQAQQEAERLGVLGDLTLPSTKALAKQVREVMALRGLDRSLASARGWVWRMEGIEGITTDVDMSKGDKYVRALTKLREYQATLDKAADRRRQVAEDIRQLETEHAEVVKTIEQTLGDLEECPICGAVTAHEHGEAG